MASFPKRFEDLVAFVYLCSTLQLVWTDAGHPLGKSLAVPVMVLGPGRGTALVENTVGKVWGAWESLKEDSLDSALDKNLYTF
ncbi:hypothetical protein [Phascolarctobacterium sp.]